MKQKESNEIQLPPNAEYSLETYKLVVEGNVIVAIFNKLLKSDLKILKVEENFVTCKSSCLPIEISWEMCSCHGGRIWLNQTGNTSNIHVELSDEEYHESIGVVDPNSELAWRIDTQLVDEIKKLSSYIYKVDVIGEYRSPGEEPKHSITYYPTMQSAAYSMFRDASIDPNTFEGSITIDAPNPKCHTRVTFNHRDANMHLYLDVQYTNDNWETFKEYQIEYSVFNKK